MKISQISSVIFLIIASFFFSFYFGHLGLMPLDDLQNFNSGFRVLKGDFPFKDYYSITGPLLDIWQSNFYKIFDVSWQSFVIHASLMNAIYAISLYHFCKKFSLGSFQSFFIALSGGLLMYPTAGNPTVEHHSLILSLIATLFFILGQKYNNNYKIYISIFVFFLAFFIKQVPTVYFIFICILIYFSQAVCKLNTINTFKYFFFTLGCLMLFLFYFYSNGVLINDIINQYFIIAFNLGESRFDNINLHFLYEKISKLFYLIFLVIPSTWLLISKKKKLPFLMIISLSIIICFYEIHSNNQPITFAVLPVLIIFLISPLTKQNINSKFLNYFFYIIIFYCFFRILRFEIYYLFALIFLLIYLFLKKNILLKNLIIIYLLISTCFYFEKYVKYRAWDDLNKEKMLLTFKGEEIDKKFKYLKWRTINFEDINKEKKLIIETLSFLQNLNNDTNYILISDYQIYNAVLNRKDFSPVKYWFSDATYPSKNKVLREDFDQFFKNKIIDNNISLILIDNTAKFKSKELKDFNWLYPCLNELSHEMDDSIDIFKIKADCV
ncbi:hypothetical protein HIMB5_00012690 [alpha proteobacterium HIMB5]|nr:hypothetical protein HIMB5_00012690 [alpha proteobacterium HIMB5]